MSARAGAWSRSALWAGLAFLYLPIVSMMVFSFNSSRLVTVWGGWSTQWYGALLHDRQLLQAAGLSLRIAFMTACGAVVLGTLAAVALTRFGRFRGRLLLAGMVSAPLVMPDVITGLSLLLLFVAAAPLPFMPSSRGLTTIVIAHVTLTVSYVTVLVQSRLADMDESLEEAAMDLGARPVRVFFAITLPLIAPALAAGWLLAFTLSLDDLVIASFTAGPSTNTLPMMIFSKVRLGVTPEINALATILVAAVAVLVAFAGVLWSRQQRQRQRDEQAALNG